MSDGTHALSRRAFLGLQASLLAGALASCAPGGEQDQTPEPPSSPRSLEEIRASGYLNVGLYSDSKPLSYVGSHGSYVGYDHYFCMYLTERTGLEIRRVAVDPHDRYERLYANEVDVALAEMSPSDSASDGAAFASPLLKLKLGIVSPKDIPITSVDQLSQGELIVCAGSYAEQYAAETWPDVTLRPYGTVTDAHNALRDGKGIALLDDEICALGWLKGKGGYALTMEGIGEARMVGPAVVAGQDDLIIVLNRAFNHFVNTGFDALAYKAYIKPFAGGRNLNGLLNKKTTND